MLDPTSQYAGRCSYIKFSEDKGFTSKDAPTILQRFAEPMQELATKLDKLPAAEMQGNGNKIEVVLLDAKLKVISDGSGITRRKGFSLDELLLRSKLG